LEVATRLLEKYGANIGGIPRLMVSFKGHTALHFASENGHTQMITLLLKHGANIDALNKNKESPLMAAARKGRLESISLLIQAGADITLWSYGEFTALVCAADSRQLGSVKCILDYGIFDNDELRIVLEEQ